VSLKVSDGKGGEVIQTFDISVSGTGNRSPRITSTPGTSATVGASYTYQVSANDPDGYHLTQQPAGMTINATGRIEWTPAAGVAGTQAIQVVVRDSKGASAVQNYALYVQQSNNRPPRISSTPSYKASPGVVYSYQVIGTDPDGDVLNYAITKGPVDMTMASNGLLMWLNPVLGEDDIEGACHRSTRCLCHADLQTARGVEQPAHDHQHAHHHGNDWSSLQLSGDRQRPRWRLPDLCPDWATCWRHDFANGLDQWHADHGGQSQHGGDRI